MIRIIEIWSCSCKYSKFSCKRLQVACSCKWSGYILADFYKWMASQPLRINILLMGENKYYRNDL